MKLQAMKKLEYSLKRRFTLWCRDNGYVTHDELGLTILLAPLWVVVLARWLFSPSILAEEEFKMITKQVDDAFRRVNISMASLKNAIQRFNEEANRYVLDATNQAETITADGRD